MRISVFGIGYVGAVVSACLAESGHEVIAVDIDAAKIDLINRGLSPVAEPGLADLIARHTGAKILSATGDAKAAVLNSDISLICVGTPSNQDGTLNLDHAIAACRSVGAALREKDSYHCIVVRSTTLPGMAVHNLLPVLEEMSGKQAGPDFGFGHNPEFLREGSAIADYLKPPQIVIGAYDEKSGRQIAALYEGIDAPIVRTTIEVAEGVKYACNAWHAVKIGFANEIGNIFSAHNLDSHAVMDIFCYDQVLNISKAYLRPGFAFGGSCLPKDVRGLQALAAAHSISTPLLDGVMSGNAAQVERAFFLIKQSCRRRVALLGLAFKPGTDDLRESPLLALAMRLADHGFDLKIYDGAFAEADPSPALPASLFACLQQDVPKTVKDCDLVVIGHDNAVFKSACRDLAEDVMILDLVRIDPVLEQRALYRGLCW